MPTLAYKIINSFNKSQLQSLNNTKLQFYNSFKDKMIFFEKLLLLANQLLTFYIPTFYTFKFLMNNNTPKVRTVLKFWCVLTLYHLVQWVLSHVIAENLFPVIDLVVLVGLNWKQMEYAELIFDKVIGPAFTNNKQAITKISSQLQKLFNKKTQTLKNKVAQSTGEKLKGFIGQILVGTLNPSLKRKDSSQEESSQAQEDEDGYQKQQ